MIDSSVAEFLKLRRHAATWLLVWIYPICVALLLSSTLIREVVLDAAPEKVSSAADWLGKSRIVWAAPQSAFGRFVMAGFCAMAFAGEYGWNTWKLLIPVRLRWQLIAAKWIVVTGLLFVSFIAADALVVLGDGLRAALGLKPVPADLGGFDVIRCHLEGLAQAFLPIIYTVAWAGLLAVTTRSVLATMLLSIAVVWVEQSLVGITGVLAGYAAMTTKLGVTLLPFYHVGNVVEYFRTGKPLILFVGPGDQLTLDWQVSLTVSAGWILGIGAVTLLSFERQDHN